MPVTLVWFRPALTNIRHGSSSVGCRKGSDTENDRQAIIERKPSPDCQVYPKLALALPTASVLGSLVLNLH